MRIKIDVDKKTNGIRYRFLPPFAMIIDGQKILVPGSEKEVIFTDYDESMDTAIPEGALAYFIEQYEGTREYDGVVAECQIWYYGSLIKAPWCATFLSYCLDSLGILERNLSHKQENVYNMYLDMKERCDEVTLEDAKRGDIVFLAFDEYFGWSSSKHVTVFEEMKTDTYLECIGGNQSDMIKKSLYNKKDVYAIFRPNLR